MIRRKTVFRHAGTREGRKIFLAARRGVAVLMAVVSAMCYVTAKAQDGGNNTFNLTPAAAFADCLPDATARVTVFPKEDTRGVDTFDLKAQGLPPNTGFAVFLTESPGPQVGAVEYIGDFTTNAAGRGTLRVDAIVDEAFSSTVVGTTRVRKDLNHVVIWFADPAGDDVCLGEGKGPTTPFDGDGVAGAAVLTSSSSLPGAPLP